MAEERKQQRKRKAAGGKREKGIFDMEYAYFRLFSFFLGWF